MSFSEESLNKHEKDAITVYQDLCVSRGEQLLFLIWLPMNINALQIRIETGVRRVFPTG